MDGSVQKTKVLALDLSTSSTGYAIFEAGELQAYGNFKASSAGLSKLCKLQQTLKKMERIAGNIDELVATNNPDVIVIEEIAGSKNRISQKTLDGFHWIVLKTLEHSIDKIVFYDVSGTNGWRRHLQLRLSDADKAQNKEARTLNKKLAKGTKKLPIINFKHLACRHVNRKFGTAFDVDENTTDSDICDAIAMGDAYCSFTLTL